MLWERSPDAASNALSTVDKIAETSAPANRAYKNVERCRCAIRGRICSGYSSPGATPAPKSPMERGIKPTRIYMPPATNEDRRATFGDREAMTRETSSCAISEPQIGIAHASAIRNPCHPLASDSDGTKLNASFPIVENA